MEFNFTGGPPKGRRKSPKKSRRGSKPDRRQKAREESEDRRLENDRREAERRHEATKRRAVAVLKRLEMQRIASMVIATTMIEPLVMALTFILSGAVNFSLGGFGGVAILVALLPHEFGHFHAALRAGYRPHWFRFWPFGALMKLPEMTSRSHKAYIALGGPFYGFLFTALTTAIWLVVTPSEMRSGEGVSHDLFVLALVSLLMNLFNLIMLRPLDGGRMVHGMDGAWPKWLTRVGYVILAAITLRYQLTTLYLVWVLVIGYLELPLRFAARVNIRKWRFILALLATIGILLWQWSDYAHKAWSLAQISGEIASTVLAAMFTLRYYNGWRFPERYPHEEDTEEDHVDLREGRSMRLKSFALFLAYLVNLVVLFLAL